MIVDIIGILGAFFLICLVAGFLKNYIFDFLSYVLEAILTMFLCAFLGFVVGFLIRRFIDIQVLLVTIGAVFGLVYTIYTWIRGKYNKIAGWLICH